MVCAYPYFFKMKLIVVVARALRQGQISAMNAATTRSLRAVAFIFGDGVAKKIALHRMADVYVS